MFRTCGSGTEYTRMSADLPPHRDSPDRSQPGPTEAMLLTPAAYTGMRQRELAGPHQRDATLNPPAHGLTAREGRT